MKSKDFLNELKDFAHETSIHGPAQIANDEATILKRLIWLGIFVASFACAGMQLISLFQGTAIIRSKCTIASL